jgi:hypothetical protein
MLVEFSTDIMILIVAGQKVRRARLAPNAGIAYSAMRLPTVLETTAAMAG